MSGFDGSINEAGPSRQSLSPPSINEAPQRPDLPPPVVNSLDPATVAIGAPDFEIEVHGENFYSGSIINFAGHDEPTTYDQEAGTLTTEVRPSLWTEPATVQCLVRNADVESNAVDFVFTEAAEPEPEKASVHAADPDELEDEIEAAEDDDDFKPVHATHHTRIKKK
jgi:hypothetical protein